MKKSQLYAVGGFLLGWGAPSGALVIRFFSQWPWTDPLTFVRQEWPSNAFFYWYMLLGTCLAFTGVGYLLGRNQDGKEDPHRMVQGAFFDKTSLSR